MFFFSHPQPQILESNLQIQISERGYLMICDHASMLKNDGHSYKFVYSSYIHMFINMLCNPELVIEINLYIHPFVVSKYFNIQTYTLQTQYLKFMNN